MEDITRKLKKITRLRNTKTIVHKQSKKFSGSLFVIIGEEKHKNLKPKVN